VSAAGCSLISCNINDNVFVPSKIVYKPERALDEFLDTLNGPVIVVGALARAKSTDLRVVPTIVKRHLNRNTLANSWIAGGKARS
jgi:hypothetical protein